MDKEIKFYLIIEIYTIKQNECIFVVTINQDSIRAGNRIMRKIVLLLAICFGLQSYAQLGSITITGTVKDNYGNIVAGAHVKFTSEKDTTLMDSTVTNVNGEYKISMPFPESSLPKLDTTEPYLLYPPVPNPFGNQVLIPIYVDRDGPARIVIYSITGQLLKVLYEGNLTKGMHQYLWSRETDAGMRVGSGIYICTLEFYKRKTSTKLIVYESKYDDPPIAFNLGNAILSTNGAYTFKVDIRAISVEPTQKINVGIPYSRVVNLSVKSLPVPFACTGNYLGVWNPSGIYNPIFVKGMNYGVSRPNESPGEIQYVPASDHKRWLAKIGDIGFNVIRLYTLHPPQFYEMLNEYNTLHPDSPLFVIQGIWLDEPDNVNPSMDLYSRTSDFDKSVKEVIDCVHGNNVIAPRLGRAFGTYTTNISRWVLAYIIGREIDPFEVEATELAHTGVNQYIGSNLRNTQCSPTEAWFTERLDKLLTYERSNYHVDRPVSVSSWPTLDPIQHPTETQPPDGFEDWMSIDLKGISIVDAPAGYFASYHAYPYYPDFMSQEPYYQTFSDNQGANGYVGYLKELKEHYSNRPLLIAEFGVPSSWGNAHYAYTEMHHGGHTEQLQGEYDIRLLHNIQDANCAGGAMFAWIDEWFKRTWIVEGYMENTATRAFWHNLVSPEQNFGLISFETGVPLNYQNMNISNAYIDSLNLAYDNQFFHLKLNLKNQIEPLDTFYIAFDTYRFDLGESKLPNGKIVTNRAEFVLQLIADAGANLVKAQLYVTEAYSLHRFTRKYNFITAQQKLHSTTTDGKPWKELQWQNSLRLIDVQDIGKFRLKQVGQPVENLDAVIWSSNEINVRIPWTFLYFWDPTQRRVIHRVYQNDIVKEQYLLRQDTLSDGIAISLSYKNQMLSANRFTWAPWTVVNNTVEREKACVPIIKNGLQQFNSYPPFTKQALPPRKFGIKYSKYIGE